MGPDPPGCPGPLEDTSLTPRRSSSKGQQQTGGVLAALPLLAWELQEGTEGVVAGEGPGEVSIRDRWGHSLVLAL